MCCDGIVVGPENTVDELHGERNTGWVFDQVMKRFGNRSIFISFMSLCQGNPALHSVDRGINKLIIHRSSMPTNSSRVLYQMAPQ